MQTTRQFKSRPPDRAPATCLSSHCPEGNSWLFFRTAKSQVDESTQSCRSSIAWDNVNGDVNRISIAHQHFAGDEMAPSFSAGITPGGFGSSWKSIPRE